MIPEEVDRLYSGNGWGCADPLPEIIPCSRGVPSPSSSVDERATTPLPLLLLLSPDPALPSLCIPSLVTDLDEETASLARVCEPFAAALEPEETILKLFLRRGIEGDTVVLICGNPESGIRALPMLELEKVLSASSDAGRPDEIACPAEAGIAVGGREAGAEVEGSAECGTDIELVDVAVVPNVLDGDEEDAAEGIDSDPTEVVEEAVLGVKLAVVAADDI